MVHNNYFQWAKDIDNVFLVRAGSHDYKLLVLNNNKLTLDTSYLPNSTIEKIDKQENDKTIWVNNIYHEKYQIEHFIYFYIDIHYSTLYVKTTNVDALTLYWIYLSQSKNVNLARKIIGMIRKLENVYPPEIRKLNMKFMVKIDNMIYHFSNFL